MRARGEQQGAGWYRWARRESHTRLAAGNNVAVFESGNGARYVYNNTAVSVFVNHVIEVEKYQVLLLIISYEYGGARCKGVPNTFFPGVVATTGDISVTLPALRDPGIVPVVGPGKNQLTYAVVFQLGDKSPCPRAPLDMGGPFPGIPLSREDAQAVLYAPVVAADNIIQALVGILLQPTTGLGQTGVTQVASVQDPPPAANTHKSSPSPSPSPSSCNGMPAAPVPPESSVISVASFPVLPGWSRSKRWQRDIHAGQEYHYKYYFYIIVSNAITSQGQM
eukprot:jgi/Chlat1/1897/Chrsp146S02211